VKTWITLSVSVLAGTLCLAAHANQPNYTQDGFFLGLGADFNSINLTQNSWGEGISNIQTTTGSVSNGIAEGTGAPFHPIINSLSPSFQAGYFKNIAGTPNLIGVKFFYQYLNATATDTNLYIPQVGSTTSAVTGATSALFGYVNATSVQPTINQEMALLLFGGFSIGNTSFYLGAGPSLMNLKSRNLYSIGYADFEGATIDVTGLVSYSSPSFWSWGATAQLGATYFFNPCWFIDLAYTYTLTGSHTTKHQQTFANRSDLGTTVYATSGTLYTKDTMSVKNQSVMISINKVLNF